MKLFLTSISLFSAVLFSVGILSSSTMAQAPRTTPTPVYRPAPTSAAVDTNAILGLWEGTATMDKVVTKNSFKFSRVNGTLSAVWISDQTRNLAIANISLSPDGTIIIKDIVDGATITFGGKVEPAANKMGGAVVLLANNQRYSGTWQATRKPVADAVSDEARFKQIILDIAIGKSIPDADKTWADNYEKQKMAGKASAKVAETVDQKKARAWPFFKQAMADYDASDFVGAIRGFSEYLKILPDALDARLNRGFAYNKLGQSELALADFEYVLKIKPDNPYALEEAAKTRAKLPRKVETLTSIFQVTDMKVTDAGYRELQSLIERYRIAGLTEGKKLMPNQNLTPAAYRTIRQSAIVQLRTIASRTGMLNSRFDELFPTNCPDPKAVADVMTSGEVVNSLKCIFGPSTLKAIYPDQPMTRGYFVQVFDDAVENGMSKVSSNSRGEAEPARKPASPAELKALIDQGQRLMGSKDYDGAIRMFNQVIEYDPTYIEAYRMRGISALMIYEQNPPMQGQKLYTAQFNFDHAINRGTTYPDDFYMRGMTFERQGKKDKAIADYRTALKMKPDHQGAKDALQKLGVTP